MSDLISRQAAIEALKGCEFCHYMEFGEYIGEDAREVRLIRAEKAQDAIQNLPSAQPEIIRCKDCKWYAIWQLKSDYTDDKRYKPSVCVHGRYAAHRSEDWYCADAERRTDEAD